MATAELRNGAKSLLLEGPDIVERQKALLRTQETRIPLIALSSLGIERRGSQALIVAAVGLGVIGLITVFSGNAGIGVLVLLLSAACGGLFWQTRRIVLVAKSPTGSIEFACSGQKLQSMEQFLAQAHAARTPASP